MRRVQAALPSACLEIFKAGAIAASIPIAEAAVPLKSSGAGQAAGAFTAALAGRLAARAWRTFDRKFCDPPLEIEEIREDCILRNFFRLREIGLGIFSTCLGIYLAVRVSPLFGTVSLSSGVNNWGVAVGFQIGAYGLIECLYQQTSCCRTESAPTAYQAL